MFGLEPTNRGKTTMSAEIGRKDDDMSTAWQVSKSKFTVLADKNDEVIYELEMLKQKIRRLPSGSQSEGHNKGQIKLEIGMGLKEAEDLKKHQKIC